METTKLQEVGKPLVDYLRENFQTNATAVVTQNSVEIMEGAVAVSFDDTENTVDDGKVQLSELKPGEIFHVNSNNYLVLKHEDNVTHIISHGLMKERVKFDDETRCYADSNLKRVIDEEIRPIFVEDFGEENLVDHVVNMRSVDMQNEFENIVEDVRPITFDEAREFNDLLVNKDLPGWYWTLTPWSTAERGWEYSIAVVSPVGDVCGIICDVYDGVRPFCILKSNIFVSKGEQ